MTQAVLLWFRQDLRLSDNPALTAAAQQALPVLPVFVLDTEAEGEWRLGGASRVWLNGSLKQLKASLTQLKSDLILRQGDTLKHLVELSKACNAKQIHCNRRYEPWAREQEKKLQAQLEEKGIKLVVHASGALLWEPEEIKTKEGKPYQVFTAYFKRCLENPPHIDPLPTPEKLLSPSHRPESLRVEMLALTPGIAWDTEIRQSWKPGEHSAQELLQIFLENKQQKYGTSRNFPACDGTSRLSPYLHTGEISPRQIWTAVTNQEERTGADFLREIIWREFAYHILYHFPQTPTQPLKEKFASLQWKNNSEHFSKWCRGETGYPIVDAGMRQLWRTGWMHNRVRMIVGSFLTKDLLIPWQDGARWFWDTLVDADLANNSLGWQWVSGCGADAQPFFRIFNPVLQSKKFDGDGDYIRRWVPELTGLSAKYIHEPWKAPAHILEAANIALGVTYPEPIVDHAQARIEALKRFQKL